MPEVIVNSLHIISQGPDQIGVASEIYRSWLGQRTMTTPEAFDDVTPCDRLQ